RPVVVPGQATSGRVIPSPILPNRRGRIMAEQGKIRVEQGIRRIGPSTFEVRAGRRIGGKPIQVSRTVEGGIRKARQVRTELETELAARPDVATTKSTVETRTLGDLLDEWVANGKR